MAEAIAFVGLTVAIIDMIHYSQKVARRLKEFQDECKDSPKVFQEMRERLPVTILILTNVKEQVEGGQASPEAQEAMLPVLERCHMLVKRLDAILEKILPEAKDSQWHRVKKVFNSMSKETEIKDIDESLKVNVNLLCQAASVDPNMMNKTITNVQNNYSLVVDTGSLPDATAAVSGSSLPSRPGVGHARPVKPVFLMPYRRDKRFIDRDDILDRIENALQKESQVALAGLGGIGKSQIAIEYIYRYHSQNPKSHVFWIHASTTSRFEQGYQDIAKKVAIPGVDDVSSDTLQLVYDWLCNDTHGEWLLVVDNADDEATFYTERSTGSKRQTAKALMRYLPQNASGRTLFTTRDRRLGERLTDRRKPIDVPPMTPEGAVNLLRHRITFGDDELKNAQKLVQQLAYLPLAITQAASFMSENSASLEEYLDMLNSSEDEVRELLSEELDDSRRDSETDNAVMRTWKLSFVQISKQKPRAAEILSLMSVLGFHSVPRRLLKADKESKIAFRTAIGVLQAFSLVTLGEGNDGPLKMHRLVALSTRKWLESHGALEDWKGKALRVVFEQFPKEWRFEHWPTLSLLTPHAHIVTDFEFERKADKLDCATLLDFAALYDMSTTVRYLQARDKCLRSLDLRTSVLSDTDEITLRSHQTLGEAYLHTGELLDAKKHLQLAITGREVCLGAKHPDTLESISDLTITLLDLDDLDEAEKSALRAYEGRKEVLGPEDPDTIVSLNIISLLRQRQDKLDEALKITNEVLEARIRLEGPGDPLTLMTMNNKGVLLYKQAHYQEAQKLLEETIAGEAKVLGAERYDAQVSMSNLARTLAAQGNLKAARSIHERVLQLRMRFDGPSHPGTLLSCKYLAELNKSQSISPIDDVPTAPVRRDSASLSMKVLAGALLADGLLYD